MSNLYEFHFDDTNDPTLEPHNATVDPSARRSDSIPVPGTLGRSFGNVNIPIQHVNEFHTLLEAAEQVANAPHIDPDDTWHGEINAAPQIRRRSRPTTHGQSRRVSLTRRYSGRPHVPGEDSGSEGGHEHGEYMEEDDPWTYQEIAASHMRSSDMAGAGPSSLDTTRAGLELDYNEQRVLDNAREQIQNSRAEVERAEYEVIAQRDSSAERRRMSQRERLSDDIEQSERRLLDLQRRTDALLQQSEVRIRSLSTSTARRWRPSERLQDFASNTARREGQPESDNAAIAAQLDRSVQARSSDDLTGSGSLSTAREIRPVADPPVRRSQVAQRNPNQALEEYQAARRELLRLEQQIVATGAQARNNNLSQVAGTSDWPVGQEPPSTDEAYSVHDFIGRSRYTGDSSRVPEVSSTLRSGTQESTRDWAARTRQVLSRNLNARAGRRPQQQVDDPMDIATGPLFNQRTGPNMFDDAEPDRRRLRELMRTLSSGRRDASHSNPRRSTEMAHDELTKSLDQAKDVLDWLARLRRENMSREQAWDVATKMGLHNLDLEDDARRQLPISIDDLPVPKYSSWLQPGTIWEGTQTAETTLDRAVQLSNYRQRHLDGRRLRSERARVEGDSRWFANWLLRSRRDRQDPLDRVFNPRSDEDETMAVDAVVLENAERSLSYILDRSRRYGNNQDEWASSREDVSRTEQRQTAASDNTWNVSITLHSVDWVKSTITGTMSASELPGQKTARSTDPSTPGVDVAMDSFFTGEMIDFQQHGLDTVASSTDRSSNDKKRKALASDYSPGGLQTDLLYWSSLPPFRTEIEKASEIQLQANIQDARTKIARAALDRQSASVSDPSPSDLATYAPLDPTAPHIILDLSHTPIDCSLTAEQLLQIRQTTMTSLLSDTRWLTQHIGNAEYVLMRWKERCFVSDGLSPNPNSIVQTRGSHLRNNSTTRVYSTVAADRDEQTNANNGGGMGTWGLTISGFYYISLNRRTGSIEGLYYDAGAGPFQKLRMEVVNSATGSDKQSAELKRKDEVDLQMNGLDSVEKEVEMEEETKEENADEQGHRFDQTKNRGEEGSRLLSSADSNSRSKVKLNSQSKLNLNHGHVSGGLRSAFGIVEFR